jgi:hypothetical protein
MSHAVNVPRGPSNRQPPHYPRLLSQVSPSDQVLLRWVRVCGLGGSFLVLCGFTAEVA